LNEEENVLVIFFKVNGSACGAKEEVRVMVNVNVPVSVLDKYMQRREERTESNVRIWFAKRKIFRI
jgi:hypothetical protein